MNIAVCIKHVPSVLDYDIKSNSIRRKGVTSEINPFDLFAIEEAVRIKEKKGATTTAICMGVEDAKKSLKRAIAMGIDNAVLLCDKKFSGSDTQATSYILSEGLKRTNNFDLILCGKQSSDGDTAQVGVQIAEKLGLPFLTNVVDINFLSNSIIECKRLLESGYQVVEVPIPAVISVNKGINEPRIPTVKNLIHSENVEPDVLSVEDIKINSGKCGRNGSPTRVVNISFPQLSPTFCQEIKGTYDDQIGFLINLICAESKKQKE